MSKIYLIGGKAQNGKDTLAGFMKHEFERAGKKVLILHFADYLKYICKNYFGWDGTKSDEGRYILQHVGTDLIRAKKPDFWITAVRELIEVLGEEYDYYLIPDTRFKNELSLNVSGMETKTIRVKRLDFISPLTLEQQNHQSEIDLDYEYFHLRVYAGDLIELLTAAKNIVDVDLTGTRREWND